MATHHAELAASIADHVVVLSDGAVIAEGPPDVALAAIR
jgi:ABC-type cobalamin/Fe3+-siderophores transport system ATPase subunit